MTTVRPVRCGKATDFGSYPVPCPKQRPVGGKAAGEYFARLPELLGRGDGGRAGHCYVLRARRPASVILSRRKLSVRPPAFTVSGFATANPTRTILASGLTVTPCARNVASYTRAVRRRAAGAPVSPRRPARPSWFHPVGLSEVHSHPSDRDMRRQTGSPAQREG
jgi:hypothetical protein